MRIDQIDKNFAQNMVTTKDGWAEYTIPHPSFALYGIFYDEKEKCFARMDIAVANEVNDGVRYLCKHTTGGRLRFATDSNKLKLSVTYTYLWVMEHMPMVGSCGFTLFEETEKGAQFVTYLAPIRTDEEGFTREIQLPGEGMRSYTLYFPLYNDLKTLTVSLEEGAKVEQGKKHKDILPILYYGSSITQGGCAGRPDTGYQGLIHKKNNVDFINLGFSGNGKAEDNMVDYLASIDCSLFVCDYDHNAQNPQELKKTHFRLYEIIRQRCPDVPYIMITRPDFPPAINRKSYDNSVGCRIVVIDSYNKAIRLGDKNVYFIDGSNIFKGQLEELCTVDGIHPNDLGFHLMAETVEHTIRSILFT
jgi:lysophospholipase L1-like esterase